MKHPVVLLFYQELDFDINQELLDLDFSLEICKYPDNMKQLITKITISKPNVIITFGENWKDFNKILTKSNISRKDCLLLPINTVLSALTN